MQILLATDSFPSPSQNLWVFFIPKCFSPTKHPCSLPTSHLLCLLGKNTISWHILKRIWMESFIKKIMSFDPGTFEVCRAVCPFTKWSQTALFFQFLCLFSIIFCLFFAANLLCLLHSPQFLTHEMCLLKINFCFWKSEIARILGITIHFLTQEFTVHTKWDSLISIPRDWKKTKSVYKILKIVAMGLKTTTKKYLQ